MHILDKWNSLGEKFWSVHEFMQIYYLFRSSGTGSLNSRINKRLYIFSVFKYYDTIMHETRYCSHDRKETECNPFLLFSFPLLSGATAEGNGIDFPDRVTICI